MLHSTSSRASLLTRPGGFPVYSSSSSQITTTERFYGHVDLEEKRKAIEANPPPVKPGRGRWRRPEVLEFLKSL
jgi:hypothetical protein